MVEAAHTSAVHRLFIGVVEHSELSVSVVVTHIGSRSELIALVAGRVTFICDNKRVQPIIAKVSVVIQNYAGVVVLRAFALLGRAIDIGDKAEILIDLSRCTCSVLAVYVLTLVLQRIIGGVLDVIIIGECVDIRLCTDNISVFYAKVLGLFRSLGYFFYTVDVAEKRLA